MYGNVPNPYQPHQPDSSQVQQAALEAASKAQALARQIAEDAVRRASEERERQAHIRAQQNQTGQRW